jgi:hypothetical protein
VSPYRKITKQLVHLEFSEKDFNGYALSSSRTCFVQPDYLLFARDPGTPLPWSVWELCNIEQTHIWELSKVGVTTKTHRAALLPTLSLCD